MALEASSNEAKESLTASERRKVEIHARVSEILSITSSPLEGDPEKDYLPLATMYEEGATKRNSLAEFKRHAQELVRLAEELEKLD